MGGGGCWVLGVWCWVLGFGCWVLGVGCWVLGVGCWVLGVGCCVLGVESWVLRVGCWVCAARVRAGGAEHVFTSRVVKCFHTMHHIVATCRRHRLLLGGTCSAPP